MLRLRGQYRSVTGPPRVRWRRWKTLNGVGLLPSWRFGRVGLVMFGQVGFLPEALATQWATEWLLSRVCPDVHVDRIPVFETLVAYVTVVEKSWSLPLPVTAGTKWAGHGPLCFLLIFVVVFDQAERLRREHRLQQIDVPIGSLKYQRYHLVGRWLGGSSSWYWCMSRCCGCWHRSCSRSYCLEPSLQVVVPVLVYTDRNQSRQTRLSDDSRGL